MRTLTMTAATVLLGLALVAARGAPTQDASRGGLRWTHDGELLVLDFDEQGVKLTDFLGFAADVLHVAVQYDARSVEELTLWVEGSVRLEPQHALQFVEALLDSQGLVIVEATFGGSTMLGLRLNRGQQWGAYNDLARPVDLAELDAWRSRKVLIMVVVPLQHVDARRALEAWSSLLAAPVSHLRLVEDSNALILVERADFVCRLVDAMRAADVPEATQSVALRFANRLDETQARCDDFEARLTALESR